LLTLRKDVMFGPHPATVSDMNTPEASLSDFQSMEVLGSVPIWVLTGLRLERTGARLVAPGWVVGVYKTEDDGQTEVVPSPAAPKRKFRKR
jgi:hypothetical protein